MKYIFLLTMFLLSEFKICKAQNASLFDSLESTFDSISIGAKMPCQWKMTLQKKANGKLTFFEKDSTSIEFDHFKANSLPFYLAKQNDFETAKKYYQWILEKCSKNKNITITKIEENNESGYIIYKIKETFGEFVRIVTKKDNILYTIKISVTELTRQKQIDKLTMLLELNTN